METNTIPIHNLLYNIPDLRARVIRVFSDQDSDPRRHSIKTDQSTGNEHVIRPPVNLWNNMVNLKNCLVEKQKQKNLRVEHGPMSKIPSGIQGLRVQ